MMAAPPPPPMWQPTHEGMNQILQLLTDYAAPGANQQRVRDWSITGSVAYGPCVMHFKQRPYALDVQIASGTESIGTRSWNLAQTNHVKN